MARLTDRIDASSLPTVDCFLPEQDRFASIYGTSIQSFGKCCSICQKAKLYAIELSSCKHKFYTEPMLEQTFNDCCYSRLYQTNRPTASLSSITSNDHLINTEADKTSQLPQLTGKDLEHFLNNGLTSNNGLKSALSGNSLPSSTSSLLSNQINQQTGQQLMRQPINNLMLNAFGLLSSIEHTNDILHQLQMNVDIEKVYLSKAKLMLSIKRNETLITNLTDEERSLLLKALDTSKLDYTIKRLTSLIQNNSSSDLNTLASSSNLASSMASNLASSLSSRLGSNLASNLASNLGSSLPSDLIGGNVLSNLENPSSNLMISSLISGLSNVASSSNTYPSNLLASMLASSNLINGQPMGEHNNNNGSLHKDALQNDLLNEFANRPLASTTIPSSANLIEQLQLLLANKWINNNSMPDHYSNQPIEDEITSGLLEDEHLETLNPIDEIV